jgi:hypothetical protein
MSSPLVALRNGGVSDGLRTRQTALMVCRLGEWFAEKSAASASGLRLIESKIAA